LVVLTACLLFLSFDEKPDLIAALDARGIDTMFRFRGQQPTRDQVVIIDIDEQSLAAYGQWPWPRNIIADLIDQVREAGAKVVGFDVVFAEPDRTSPGFVLEQIADKIPQAVVAENLDDVRNNPDIDHDQLFGKAISRLPAVLGYIFLHRDDGLKDPFATPFPSLNLSVQPDNVRFDQLTLIHAYRAIINIPSVSQATSEGFFNFLPDASGMVHKVPLFMQLDGIPYPSLAFEMTRIGQGLGDAELQISQLYHDDKRGLIGVGLGEQAIPTDDYGQMTINYRGPIGTFPYVSALDVARGAAAARLKDKYVLIGTTAAGLNDLRSTPFSTVFPGVEIHATIIDNLLSGDPMRHDPVAERGFTFVFIVLGGILLSAILAYGSPLISGLAGVSALLAPLVLNYAFYFSNNTIIGMTYPSFVALTIFLVVTIFNYFFEGREKRFINDAFGRYVSPKVVQQLKRDPKRLSLQGEERELSILFSDIRGFTSLSEQLTAGQLGRFMNRYLTVMSREILEHRGTLDKFIGDAIMAIWNAPLDDDGHAIHAVRSALAMSDRLTALLTELKNDNLPTFDIGIGINTGEASVGNFGSEERFDYTVIGDNVNLASRLEGLSKIYGVRIIISESTYTALMGKFSCRLLDRVRVKGKNRPVNIYEALCEGDPDVRDKEHLEAFNRALAAYFATDFSRAEEILLELVNADPQPLYRLYLERIAAFYTQPPARDWDGVTTLNVK